MKITIAGAGYVGLAAGACYAATGNHVTMADIDPDRVAMLRRGECPIYEPGLAELLQENIRAERIEFTSDLASACKGADVIGIAVGTPAKPDGTPDLQYVMAVAEAIGKSIDSYCVVVTKSTVPVGTGEQIVQCIRGLTEVPFDYVSNPEFLKEGTAVDDFMYPQRVIIGVDGERAKKVMTQLYMPFMRRSNRIITMSVVSAELTKYACNAMLATRISFMNELARLADRIGADIKCVRTGMGTDSRIGNAFLFPGLGYGGSCFSKDVQALIHRSQAADLTLEIVTATHAVNEVQTDYFFDKIASYFDGQLDGRRFGIWGLSFKPRTDDMREAPSLKLINKLIAAGATIVAHDPEAMDSARATLGDRIDYGAKPYEMLDQADGLVVCTEWLEFRNPDFRQIAERLSMPVIFDGRNLYDADFVNEAGLDYVCVGRPDALCR